MLVFSETQHQVFESLIRAGAVAVVLPTPGCRMKKILVVEDETLLREIILDILSEAGFEVTGAENGPVGVQLAKEQVPDLVLCNVTLPELDGYGVLRALRRP